MTDPRTIRITGASSGIGKALALGWVGQGAKLILSGRDRQRLDDVAAEIGGGTLVLPFEVTDEAAATNLREIAAGTREIVVAQGFELAMAEMRRTPDELFDQVAGMVAAGYIEKMEAQD